MIETARASLGGRTVYLFRKRNVQLALLAIAWIWTIAAIAAKETQWDFKVYYYATVAQAHGETPYDLEVLNKYSPDKIIFPFVYPVLTCYVFRPFIMLPYGVAYQVWLFLKVALAIYLIWLWRMHFLLWGALPLMILIGTGTYLGAMYRDFNSGNVTLIEQALLWTGFYWLLEEKPYRFTLAVVAAALFKFSLAAFLATLLFTRIKNKASAFALGIILLAGYVTVVWASDPQLFDNLLQAGANIKEYTANYNHSSFAVIHDIAKLFTGDSLDTGNGGTIIIGIYLAFIVVVTAITLKCFKYFRGFGDREAMYLKICALCLLYVLIMPRMKNYALIILAVPTYLVLTAGMSRKAAIVLTFLLILPRIKIAAPETAFGFYQYIHPWLMAFVVWLIFVSYVRRGLANLPWRG